MILSDLWKSPLCLQETWSWPEFSWLGERMLTGGRIGLAFTTLPVVITETCWLSSWLSTGLKSISKTVRELLL